MLPWDPVLTARLQRFLIDRAFYSRRPVTEPFSMCKKEARSFDRASFMSMSHMSQNQEIS